MDGNPCYTYKNGVFYCDGNQLSSLGDYFYKLGNTLYYSCLHEEKNKDYDEQCSEYELQKRIDERGDGPENDGRRHPAYEGYDKDEYIYGTNNYDESKNIIYNYPKGDIEGIEVFREECGDFFWQSQHYLYQVTNISLDEFLVVGKGYIKVGSEIFHNLKKVSGASGDTFKIINDDFATDDKYIYQKTSIEDDYGNKFYTGELQSFKILQAGNLDNRGGNYVSDGESVYIKPNNNKITYQGNNIFYYLELNGVDVESFTSLNYYFARDKNSIYFLGEYDLPEKISDSDIHTFEIIEDNYSNIIAEDKNYKYFIEQDNTLSKVIKNEKL